MNPKAKAKEGNTPAYLMIGSPITQVKSPAIFNRYFREQGIEAEMRALNISPDQLTAFLAELRQSTTVKGCIVTVPHKRAAAQQMDELSDRARALSSVNVIRVADGRLIGDMVDGLGFVNALRLHGFDPKGKRVALIGIGAAGSAIAHAIAESGASHISLQDINESLYPRIRDILLKTRPNLSLTFGLNDLKGFDLAINASPVGMDSETDLPFPTLGLSPHTFVAEVVTEPKLTPWLRAALKAGCPVLYGEEMVRGQIGLTGKHMGLDIPAPSSLRAD